MMGATILVDVAAAVAFADMTIQKPNGPLYELE